MRRANGGAARDSGCAGAGVLTRHGARTPQVVTFDAYGVSGHVNHASTSAGCRWLAARRRGIVFTELESVGLVRKYMGAIDALASGAVGALRGPEYRLVWTADLRATSRCMAAHESQYVWFRRLFVLFSRYAVLNTVLVVPPPPSSAPRAGGAKPSES